MREIEYHDSDVIERFKNESIKENTNAVWNKETCTIPSGPTNAFGIFSLNYFFNFVFFFKFNFTSKGEIVFAGNENVSSKVRKTTKPWTNINLDCVLFFVF